MQATRSFAAAFFVGLLIVAPPSAAAADEDPYIHHYTLQVLEPEAAEAIAWKLCPPPEEGHCRVAVTAANSLFVEAGEAVHRRVGRALAEAENVPAAQVFQITLLLGERNGDRGLDALSDSARRALTDARSLLPYSGYTSLGTGLVRTDRNAAAIVNGPDGADYRCAISFQNSVTLDGRRLIVRRFELNRLPSRSADSAETVPGVEVLSTSFGMKPGETVVVGTSKLEGADRALVVLLTAKG